MAKLFYDDEYDALAQTIANSSRPFKHCAAFLYPHLKPESQYARLKACLNSDKDERLSFGQIIALCKYCECFDALYFMADELAHARPERRTPEDEFAILQREYIDAVNRLAALAPKIEQAQSRLRVA